MTPASKLQWLLKHLVQFLSAGSVLIFVTKKLNTEELASTLTLKEFEVLLLHGDMDQTERNKVITMFKKQESSWFRKSRFKSGKGKSLNVGGSGLGFRERPGLGSSDAFTVSEDKTWEHTREQEEQDNVFVSPSMIPPPSSSSNLPPPLPPSAPPAQVTSSATNKEKRVRKSRWDTS
ncbi:hypothetical protein LSTR_LSTR012158 [Laodelphax striatellus]|uniref:Helicase C-terminal domain-containing protein n=1 Tax=Laodelphax striatellus TaxID=195883 RepID=A0A482WPJ5_LAOST|nr:hypothetical protein LSTR_LSTR012158 [Laodelphax striatellus]